MQISHDYRYEERLVAYVDILGWTDQVEQKNDAGHYQISSDVKAALAVLDQEYSSFTEHHKIDIKNRFGVDKVNPLFQHIECGIFSDSILISKPVDYGVRIFSIVEICRKLLTLGFLCRGAITKGYCYHKENRIFGPVLNEAINLEQNEAIYPRILCTKEIEDLVDAAEEKPLYITTDFLGRKVANLFMLPPQFDLEENELRVLIENAFEVAKIKEKIASMKENFQCIGNFKIFEKWHYAELLMKSQLDESFAWYSK